MRSAPDFAARAQIWSILPEAGRHCRRPLSARLARCGRMGAKGSKDNASETEEAVSVAPPTAAEPTPPGCPRCGLPGEGAGAFCQCRSCKTYMSHTQLYSRVEPPMKAPAAAAPELRKVDPGVEEESTVKKILQAANMRTCAPPAAFERNGRGGQPRLMR